MGGNDGKKERFIGETGPEDDILATMDGETDGATFAEIKQKLEAKGRAVDDDTLKSLLKGLVEKKTIRFDEKLGYFYADEERE